MNKRILQAEAKYEKARLAKDKVIADEQSKCKHPLKSVYEVEYVKGFMGCNPPFRVCTLCGYAEQGWGCGYYKLDFAYSAVLPKITSDEAYRRYIKVFYSQSALSQIRLGLRND